MTHFMKQSANIRASGGGREYWAARLATGAGRLGIVCAELWIAQAWALGVGSAIQLMAAHVAAAASYGAVAVALRRHVGGRPIVEATTIALTGPLGLMTLVLAGGAVGVQTHKVVRTDGDIMDAAERLDAAIRADRRPRRDPTARRSLMQRITDGDLAEQQEAITVIALRYEPRMHSALMAALRSTTPALRVQAAAAFAKLRERSVAEARSLLCEDPERLDAARAERMAQSPFLDLKASSALLAVARRAAKEPVR